MYLKELKQKQELDVVKKLNGEVIQGYLFSKPLNIDDFVHG